MVMMLVLKIGQNNGELEVFAPISASKLS